MSDTIYTPSFYSQEESNKYFAKLSNELPWEKDLHLVGGGTKKIKRSMCHFGDNIGPYKYANFILPTHTFTPTLDRLRNEVACYLSVPFNSVLCNYYADGKGGIRWHSDNEVQLGEDPIIAMINLGATRHFHMLRKNTGERMVYPLANGDLFVMLKDCQKNWLHAILPESGIIEPRISLTFRWLYQ